MKKILLLSAVAALVMLAACNSKSNTNPDGKVLTYVDTIGLADFQAWKTQNELKDPSVYYSQGKTYATARKTTAKRSVSKPVTMTSQSQNPAKKKGWSSRAKGAAIGGGGGAILGAVINKKNRVAGGILGGAIGAGLGYVLGNEIDRKNGRR